MEYPWKTLWIPGSHFTSTGITRIIPEYYKLWNERSNRARKRFLSQTTTEGLILKNVLPEEFVAAFKKISVKHSFKNDYIRYYLSMCAISQDAVRSFVVYSKEGKPLA